MDYSDIWKEVQAAMLGIFDGQHTAPHLVDLQRRLLNFLMRNRDYVQWFSDIDALLTEQVLKILQSLGCIDPGMILEEFSGKWSDYHKSLQIVDEQFSFSQLRTVRKRLNMPDTIYEGGAKIWKEKFLISDALARSITNALVELLCKQRKGEVVNKGLIRGVIQKLRRLGASEFEKLYEKPFLEATGKFYQSISQQLIMETGDAVNEKYKFKAESIVEEEIERFRFYSESEAALRKLYSVLKREMRVTPKFEVI